MRKILSILTVVGLTATAASTVVACGNNKATLIKTVNRSAEDLVLTPDHTSATLNLSQVEALKLELVQLNENKYTNGVNLPTSDQVTNTNGVNITATFTPDLTLGTVLINLKADKAMVKTSDVSFTFGSGSAKLTITNLNLDYAAKQVMNKSAVLGENHQSATLELSTAETIALGLMEMGDSGHYQFGKNYPFATAGKLTTKLVDGTTVNASIEIAADATTTVSLTSDRVMDGNTSVNLVIGDYVLVVDYNVVKRPVIGATHHDATLTLSTQEALLLDLVKTTQSDGDKTYSTGENWKAALVTNLDETTVTANFVFHDNDGSVVVVLSTTQPMIEAKALVLMIGTYKLVVNQLNLDWKQIARVAMVASDYQSATLKLSTAETIALGLMEMGDSGHYQFGKNYPFPTNGTLTLTFGGIPIIAVFEPSSDATMVVKLTTTKPLTSGSKIVVLLGDYTLTIKIN